MRTQTEIYGYAKMLDLIIETQTGDGVRKYHFHHPNGRRLGSTKGATQAWVWLSGYDEGRHGGAKG